MSLSVTAYKVAELLPDHEAADACGAREHIATFTAGEFAEHADRVRLRLTDLTHRLDYGWWTEATTLAAGRGLIEFQ
jgi:hypothetical protein